jgi:hypothetical protein
LKYYSMLLAVFITASIHHLRLEDDLELGFAAPLLPCCASYCRIAASIALASCTSASLYIFPP